MITARPAALLLAAALGAAACGDGSEQDGGTATTPSAPTAAPYGAQVASYDLAADGPQRFLVGLIAADGGLAPPDSDGPHLREGDEGVGVYEATGVTFDEPGFWGVTVHATVDGDDLEFDAAFEVNPEHQIVDAGDPAPRTVNLLPGTTEAPPKAVDSRAEDDGTIPDPELHQLTVADAIATGKPTLLVVSTPVFCVSRFCGPITDSVQALAVDVGEQANFVHIEVWKDFEGNVLNRAAAEWIYPDPNVDPSEPWVFLIDGTGTIVQRWDNVANQATLSATLSTLLD